MRAALSVGASRLSNLRRAVVTRALLVRYSSVSTTAAPTPQETPTLAAPVDAAAAEPPPPPTADSDGRGVFVVPPEPAAPRGRHLHFKKVFCAHRGEGAVRIFRATTELAIASCGVYAFEDRYSPHRYKADESFMIYGSTPSAAYTDIVAVVKAAKGAGADAVHPGYGRDLAESAAFADACARAGIVFIGPPPAVLRALANRTAMRQLAARLGLPVLAGSPAPVDSEAGVRAFIAEHGLPVIIKPARRGGRGRGHVVAADADVADAYARARSDAVPGDAAVMVERYLTAARHIEVQVLADKSGNVVALGDRDCSLQLRGGGGRVIAVAPARDLPPALRTALHDAATALAKAAGYVGAGTVAFLVDASPAAASTAAAGGPATTAQPSPAAPPPDFYFLSVTPRLTAEHAATEEVSGVDIVQAQIRIAAGETLLGMELAQGAERAAASSGVAITCSVTAEDPARNFETDAGTISVYRAANGHGIRLDDGAGAAGAPVTPFYDALLVKVTAHAPTFDATVAKLTRALREHRVRGVATNLAFLVALLNHRDFKFAGGAAVTTRFVESHPEILASVVGAAAAGAAHNRGERLLRFLSLIAVNGPDPALGATGPSPRHAAPTLPKLPLPRAAGAAAGGGAKSPRLRDILVKHGATAFAAAVRAHRPTLVMDTTWRDAQQSLLATRVRTVDLLASAPATREALAPAYALEMWGGATFDTCLRHLRESPWDRLDSLRAAVPDIPFAMLMRGANAVGNSAYPDNAVSRFCDAAVQHGIDIFRVFDSLNYLPSLQLGIDAVGAAGGVVEAAIVYTGDVFAGEAGARGDDYRYKLEYYLRLARSLVASGAHVLAVKDSAGILTPQATTTLIAALRAEFPSLPLHVHTHDTAATGVASMAAAVAAGADVIDGAIDALAGTTSQPALGALAAALAGSPRATELDLRSLGALNDYWEEARALYSPFESGQLAGSCDVYEHGIPGGQYTNLFFQSRQRGPGHFAAVKRAYAAANRLLGDIPKATPSSKAVGDLAQFMVANKLGEADVAVQAGALALPESVVEYLQGALGVPPGGFPEPFRSDVLKGRGAAPRAVGGRPGSELAPLDFATLERQLREQYGDGVVRDIDALSAAFFPASFASYMRFTAAYGDVSVLPTRFFVAPLAIGEEVSLELERGKTLYVRLRGIGEVDDTGHRDVYWELNGEARVLRVADAAVTAALASPRGGA